MTIDEAFAIVVRELRRRDKLTRIELAKRIGFTYQSVWELETSRVSTKLVTFQKLAAAFNMPMEELMKRTVLVSQETQD